MKLESKSKWTATGDPDVVALVFTTLERLDASDEVTIRVLGNSGDHGEGRFTLRSEGQLVFAPR